MSTLKELKKYLVGDGGYLLNDDNNGKTVMLSGAWGSGKTHFWQNEIIKEQKEIEKDGKKEKRYTKDEYEEGLSYKLNKKKKACVYVSLYGKPSMESIELDLYMNAYKNIEGDADFISKTCSVFTSLGKNLGNMAHRGAGSTFEWLGNLVDKDKLKKAGEYLEDGGLICFDDFERKSKNIDLNDLFGFISQLTLEYNCKVVIILNSDVFEGEEANVFKTVKEKTVNKFFYFEPTIEELFDSIYESNEKYKKLDDYRAEILKAIKETEELNARIYIQVLDNCLEWIEKGHESSAIRALVLGTIYFIKTNSILSFPNIKINADSNIYALLYEKDLDTYDVVSTFVYNFGYKYRKMSKSTFYEKLIHEIHTKKKHSNVQESDILEWLKNSYDNLFIFMTYGYKLYIARDIDENLYLKLSKFIKTGILPKKDKEASS